MFWFGPTPCPALYMIRPGFCTLGVQGVGPNHSFDPSNLGNVMDEL